MTALNNQSGSRSQALWDGKAEKQRAWCLANAIQLLQGSDHATVGNVRVTAFALWGLVKLDWVAELERESAAVVTSNVDTSRRTSDRGRTDG